jgi:toxin ParE1/3/4
MSRYIFAIQARKDLKEISNRIALDNPAAARRLVDEIKRKCKTVADFPNMERSYSDLLPSLQGFLVGDYIVFYFSKKNSIQVIRVLSGYRDLAAIFLEDAP